MRYQVPQFVDIEDKIVGPFTLKQFLTYLGGIFVLIPLYLQFDLSLFITLAIPVIGIAVLFAQFRLHGKSLFEVIGNAVGFSMRGQYFTWQRSAQLKPLKISGPEYGTFAPEGPVQVPNTSMLRDRAQALETDGHIITEDAEDPMAKAQ